MLRINSSAKLDEKSFVTFTDRDDRDAKQVSLAMTNRRGLKEMGRRSNWIWNRTVKVSEWLQEPEIGLRNAQLIIQLVQFCSNFFLVPRRKGRLQGRARLGKAGKSPTSGDQVAVWLHSQHLFWAVLGQKTKVAQKA